MTTEDHPPGLAAGVVLAVGWVLTAVVVYLLSLVDIASPIWLIDVLVWSSVFGALLASTPLNKRRSAVLDDERKPADRVRDLLFLLPFGVLIPGISVYLRSSRLQMSFHGYLHSAYTYEILHGHIAPANPLLAGEPPNDYWLFHVLLGGLTHLTRVAPPFAAAALNMFALVASVTLICWILRSLDLWPANRLGRACSALFVLFGLNLFGVIHVLINNSGEGGAADPTYLNSMLLSGVARSAGLLGKYLNFNGFPVGVTFFLLALGCGLEMTRRVTPLLLAGFLAGGLGALAFHVTTGVFALVVLPLALVVASLITRKAPAWEIPRRTAVMIAGAAVFCLVGLAHYALSAAASLERSARVDLWAEDNAARLLGLVYPLLPFFFLGVWVAFRQKRSDLMMLVGVGAAGWIFSLMLSLPGENQYKFDFLGGFALALVALAGWTGLRRRESTWSARFATSIAVVAVALLLANQVYTGFGYRRSHLAAERTFAYDGINVGGGESNPQAETWEWVRDNTPIDAIVVTPLVGKDEARFLPISQRIAYVVKGGPYTAGNEEFRVRRQLVSALYSREADGETKGTALDEIVSHAGGRDIVIAVPRPYRNAVDPDELGLTRIFDETGTHLFEVTGG